MYETRLNISDSEYIKQLINLWNIDKYWYDSNNHILIIYGEDKDRLTTIYWDYYHGNAKAWKPGKIVEPVRLDTLLNIYKKLRTDFDQLGLLISNLTERHI